MSNSRTLPQLREAVIMQPLDSRAVANRILEIAESKDITLTMMQLQKLVYIAHGWWLAFSNTPLTKDSPEAWQYGPVYRSVYNSFRGSGSQPIRRRASDPITGLLFSGEFSSDADGLLDQIVDSYGKMHAFQLSDITHQENTPWSKASSESGYYATISNSMIKEHFDDLRKERT